MDAVTTLYVGGTGRSGSTLLANALGSVGSVCSAGEVRFAWQRGLVEDRRCGCGEPVRSCPFWTEVFTRWWGEVPTAARAARWHAELARVTRMRTLPAWLAGRPPAGAQAVADALGGLHRAIAEVSGARVVVDSSKLPTHAALLQLSDGVDLRVVHLVRDPRATAFSWQRHRATTQRADDDETMDRFGAGKAAALWTIWNTALPRLIGDEDRVATVHYESLMDSPRATLTRCLDLAGVPSDELPLIDEHTLDVHPSHTVAGNPSRLRHGATPLRPDTEWRDALPARDHAVVSAVTAAARRRLELR